MIGCRSEAPRLFRYAYREIKARARGQSGIGTRALALCAVKDNERGHRHQKRGTVSNSIRGNINAPAPNPLGGSEAAQEGGRLRPAQPALSQDDQDLIEAGRPSRRLGPTCGVLTPTPPSDTSGLLPRTPLGWTTFAKHGRAHFG